MAKPPRSRPSVEGVEEQTTSSSNQEVTLTPQPEALVGKSAAAKLTPPPVSAPTPGDAAVAPPPAAKPQTPTPEIQQPPVAQPVTAQPVAPPAPAPSAPPPQINQQVSAPPAQVPGPGTDLEVKGNELDRQGQEAMSTGSRFGEGGQLHYESVQVGSDVPLIELPQETEKRTAHLGYRVTESYLRDIKKKTHLLAAIHECSVDTVNVFVLQVLAESFKIVDDRLTGYFHHKNNKQR